jgi:hypothetical protein
LLFLEKEKTEYIARSEFDEWTKNFSSEIMELMMAIYSRVDQALKYKV